jgi:hypothetical protein
VAVLRSLGSAPLYLNGQPVLAAPLRHGDLITIGELRVMVELDASVPGPKLRPRLELVSSEDGPPTKLAEKHLPSLSVVRERAGAGIFSLGDEGLNDDFEEVAPPPVKAPKPAPAAVLPKGLQGAGGECVEVELFWSETRLSVWQLRPGEELLAGTDPQCQAPFRSVAQAAVVKSDANGWTIAAPRPLQLFLQEGGRVLGGAELLVRGRSQADARGLLVPLPQRAVAVLRDGSLDLRIRRVPSALRVGGDQTDWKGMLAACVAAVLMMAALRVWSAAVPPNQLGGEAEFIRPRPMIVRASPKPGDKQPPRPLNEGRRDPGLAVARHQALEGEAGSRTAPRRDTRAQRRSDSELVADAGLLKALGGAHGGQALFGVALEKGTVDAMGHLVGPRVADARGDAAMGLRSLGGQGGGGDGSGLGLLRIGTNGIGGGVANYGDGKGGLRGKESGEIGLGPERPEVTGSIDPELIRKVVHEHRAQIRTCYETQLNARPDLSGKLVAAWTIDPAGAVTESHTQETTLRDRNVEGCVAARIRTWRFPIPKGGGEVFVTYPFIFTPGG